MAAEIRQVDSDQSSYEIPHNDFKDEKDTVQTNINDIEADGYIDGEAGMEKEDLPIYRAEKTELVPAEAFKWNVEGDQSPCKILSF